MSEYKYIVHTFTILETLKTCYYQSSKYSTPNVFGFFIPFVFLNHLFNWEHTVSRTPSTPVFV